VTILYVALLSILMKVYRGLPPLLMSTGSKVSRKYKNGTLMSRNKENPQIPIYGTILFSEPVIASTCKIRKNLIGKTRSLRFARKGGIPNWDLGTIG
jgi:hypothetical protein